MLNFSMLVLLSTVFLLQAEPAGQESAKSDDVVSVKVVDPKTIDTAIDQSVEILIKRQEGPAAGVNGVTPRVQLSHRDSPEGPRHQRGWANVLTSPVERGPSGFFVDTSHACLFLAHGSVRCQDG